MNELKHTECYYCGRVRHCKTYGVKNVCKACDSESSIGKRNDN